VVPSEFYGLPWDNEDLNDHEEVAETIPCWRAGREGGSR